MENPHVDCIGHLTGAQDQQAPGPATSTSSAWSRRRSRPARSSRSTRSPTGSTCATRTRGSPARRASRSSSRATRTSRRARLRRDRHRAGAACVADERPGAEHAPVAGDRAPAEVSARRSAARGGRWDEALELVRPDLFAARDLLNEQALFAGSADAASRRRGARPRRRALWLSGAAASARALPRRARRRGSRELEASSVASRAGGATAARGGGALLGRARPPGRARRPRPLAADFEGSSYALASASWGTRAHVVRAPCRTWRSRRDEARQARPWRGSRSRSSSARRGWLLPGVAAGLFTLGGRREQ